MIGLAAAALVLFFFCPKFILWRGLSLPDLPGIGVPSAAQTAEVRRARSALAQLEDPFAAVSDPIGRPIAWRLLFPLVWHYLQLPEGLYLAAPFAGCLLASGYVASLVLQRTGNRSWAALAAIVTAASPWFFVSTGWLAYFDSWMILGLLIATFSPSRLAFALVCFLVPWIDERFFLGLPLAMAVRFFDESQNGTQPRRELAKELLIALASAAVYIGLRLLWAQRGTGEAGVYAAEHLNWARLAGYSPWRCVEGIWMALRAGWFFVAVFFVLLWKREQRRLAGILMAMLVLAVGVGLVIASDIHRTLSVVVPLALGGILLAAQQKPELLRIALPAVAAADLLLPAAHVFTTDREPIFYLYVELERYERPPPEVDPQTFVGWGAAYASQQKFAEAAACFDAALALDRSFCAAHVHLATLYLNAGRLDKAGAELTEAVRRCPNDADLFFLRGVLRLRTNDQGGAADLEQALRLSPAEWPRRQEALEMLNKLREAAAADRAPSD